MCVCVERGGGGNKKIHLLGTDYNANKSTYGVQRRTP